MKTAVEIAHERGEFDRLEDGFYYWFPSGSGGVSEDQLRLIADELARINRAWQKQIDRDLGPPPKDTANG